MAAVIGALKEMSGVMSEMASMELETIAIYETAMKRVGAATRGALLTFRDAHLQHWKALSLEIRRTGSVPPPRQSLQGLRSTFDVAQGNERAVLATLHQAELELISLYERWGRSAVVPPLLRYLFRGCLADGRRRRGWLQKRLLERRRDAPRLCG